MPNHPLNTRRPFMSHGFVLPIFLVYVLAGAALLLAVGLGSGVIGGVPFWEKGNQVRVTGAAGEWTLEVNGQPLYIKGVGCGIARGSRGEDYLEMARDMGANSVRTWGTDQGTRHYLNRAARLGLYVDAGIWLNHVDVKNGYSYLGPNPYLESKRKEIIRYVRKFHRHPAVLMWNIGNEVMTFTDSKAEKIAMAQFLEKTINEVKKIDPHHPVIYTEASLADLAILQTYAPSLDIIGVNTYGSVRVVKGSWEARGIDKPFMITEFGPRLPMDSGKDENGRSVELRDQDKAMLYGDLAGQVKEFKGWNLGGYAFHLGETTQESISWWNLNQGDQKRESWWKMYELYTDRSRPRPLPRVRELRLSKTQGLLPGERIQAEVALSSGGEGDLEFGFWISTALENILEYYVNRSLDPQAVNTGPNQAEIIAPSEPGFYRVYVYVKDGYGNISSVSRTIQVVPAASHVLNR